MSILANRAKSVNNVPVDGIYVIYGNNGTGKTVLASTFPKTPQKPMLYLDFLEGGTGSISVSERNDIQVVEITEFQELDEVLTDVEKGSTIDSETGQTIPVQYSTIVFDSATQLEFLLKQYLMKAENKDKMNINLWGKTCLSQCVYLEQLLSDHTLLILEKSSKQQKKKKLLLRLQTNPN